MAQARQILYDLSTPEVGKSAGVVEGIGDADQIKKQKEKMKCLVGRDGCEAPLKGASRLTVSFPTAHTLPEIVTFPRFARA